MFVYPLLICSHFYQFLLFSYVFFHVSEIRSNEGDFHFARTSFGRLTFIHGISPCLLVLPMYWRTFPSCLSDRRTTSWRNTGKATSLWPLTSHLYPIFALPALFSAYRDQWRPGLSADKRHQPPPHTHTYTNTLIPNSQIASAIVFKEIESIHSKWSENGEERTALLIRSVSISRLGLFTMFGMRDLSVMW